MKTILDFSECSSTKPCFVCPLAKKKHLQFVSQNNLADKPFDIVHCDIWGPFHHTSHVGHRFFVTLVDGYTWFCLVYLMTNKSDVHLIIPRFYNMVTTQFDTKIKIFRSDNAKELAFLDFFASTGTLHQYSCVESPQQNSVVEKKLQHLLNVARALFFQSRVPLTFWSECILTVAYIINRTPTSLLKDKSPFAVLYDKEVDYSVLRVFGCLAFASSLAAHRTKFQPHARMSVFLGYPPGVKGEPLRYCHKRVLHFP